MTPRALRPLLAIFFMLVSPFVAHAGEAGLLARGTLDIWMQESGVYLTEVVRDSIAAEADEAVSALTADGKLTRAAVLEKIDPATRIYAKMLAAEDENEIPDLVAVILEELEPGGFWATWPKAWPRVRIDVAPLPDAVKINGELAVSPIFTYNVQVGEIEFLVEKAGYSICRRKIVAEEGGDYVVRCELKPQP